MIIRRLIWDEWNIDHIAKHHAEPEEVEEVCKGRNVFNKWKNKTYRVIGQTGDGRYLTIFLAPGVRQSYYPVTARDSTEKEKKACRRK